MSGGSCNNPDAEQRQSFTLVLLSRDAFGQTDWYLSEMKRLSARVRGVRPRKGVDVVRLPGERMLTEAAKSRKSGVEISAELLANLTAAAGKHGVAAPATMS